MKRLFFALLFAFPFFVFQIKGQNSKKEWVFAHQENKIERKVRQGQNITVKWQGLSGIFTAKGKLVDITNDSLKLQIKRQTTSVAKHNITEIKTKRKANFVEVILAGLLIVVGAILAVASLFAWLALFTFEDSDQKQVQPIFFLGAGMLALGLFFSSLSTQNRSVRIPFGKHWSVQELPTQINKMP
ncbi:MAG: hypothetical protein Q7T20_10745 [Saprospiraceae bacterium]|nr:hypothetical protein [Saprospiraceae bacterium]